MKIEENKGALQKKKNPALKAAKSIQKEKSKSPSTLWRAHETDIRGMKRDVDFLRLVEEKKKARWIHGDQVQNPPEFRQGVCNNEFFTSQEPPESKSAETDFNQAPKSFPAGSNYFDGKAKIEIFRHLESKREQLLREIFMGVRFSFTPTGRHLVLEMNVTPSFEKAPGVHIPF